jgi:hypothetical protein
MFVITENIMKHPVYLLTVNIYYVFELFYVKEMVLSRRYQVLPEDGAVRTETRR